MITTLPGVLACANRQMRHEAYAAADALALRVVPERTEPGASLKFQR